MKNLLLVFILFAILYLGVSEGQEQSAKLNIEAIPGYDFPTIVYPSIQTHPAQQMNGVLIEDAVDIRVFPSSNPQSEVHASINKSNSDNVLFSSVTNFGLSQNSIQGYYVTTDGGQSWFGNDVLPNNGLGRGDPSTAFDASGNAYIASMGPDANGDADGWMIQKSTDLGINWTSSVRATGPTLGFDKEMIAADNSTNSSYVNNVYGAWTEFIGGNSTLSYAAVKMNKSTDGGQSFTSPITLRQSNNGTGGGQGACIGTNKTGNLYICWADYSTGVVPADGIGFAKSTNGGNSFTSNVVFSYQGIRYPGADPRFNNTRVNDFPSIAVDKSNGAYAGRIYIAYPNGGNNQSDQSIIQIRYSSNEGTSWSNAQTISIATGRQNWFPWVTVDDLSGDISVIYYSLDGSTGFATNTYVAHSSDGGSTWENIKVSDVSHITAPIPGFAGGYAGDYIGICAYGGKAFPVWSDDRNGTWQLYTSPISYQFSGSVIVEQNYNDGSPVTGSTVGRWNGSLFETIIPGSQINVEGGTTEILKGDQALYSAQKYQVWKKLNDPENDVTNHHLFPITPGFPNQITSQFDHTYYSNIKIQNSLEGTLLNTGSIKFADPWYIDYTDPDYGNQARNRGMKNIGPDALQYRQRTSPFYPNNSIVYQNGNDPAQAYKGVFLNQDPTFDPNIPNYSALGVNQQDIPLGGNIGTRRFNFLNWSASPANGASFEDPNSILSGVVFKSDNVTINANLHGQGLSNNLDGLSTPSQRKIVRTIDGRLHRVYESMDHVWYEMSGDNGQSWTLMNDGEPLDNGKGENPSIAGVRIDNAYDYVLVVFQQNEGGIAGFDYSVQLNVFGGMMPNNPIPIYQRLQTATIYSSGYQYTHTEATPVLAMKPGVNTATVEVVWHTNEGLRIQDGGLSYLNSPPYNKVLSPYMVPNTSLSSINPSIATYIQNNTSGYFYMVWAENNIIKYIDFHSRQFSQVIAVSNLDGYTYDSTASLIVLDDGLARICWKGTRVFAQIDPDGNIDISKQDNRTIFKGINSNRYWYFGNNVSSPTINKADDVAYYGIIWNKNENSTYFADNSLSTIRQITGLPGSSVALSNGSTSSSMYADIFNTASAPYYLKISNSLNSYYIPQKPAAYYFASGREGTITKDTAQFYFALGDIIVDDQAIDFVEIPDSIVFNSTAVLNTWLISEDFQLTDNSSFQYSIQYGIGDSSSAAACLANLNSYVNFKLQLVDAQSSEVIGTYDEVTFNQSNVYQYSSLSYQVNTSGIGNRTVYLRLVTDDNINAGYSLGEIYAADNVLEKAIVKTKNFDGLSSVNEYTLSQNFPNPFNPATTINYQMPEDGFVTLKIYDILGKEVATLVNEQKNQGRYSVNFDASRLASGVYIYQLRVNDYASSKKMLLLK